MSDRPDWDLTWMRMARVIARRSLCDGERVGAVIASVTNRVIAVGYNNPPAGFDHQGENCLAWCPRMQDSRRVTGYQQTDESIWSGRNQLTEWGGYGDEQYIEINDWQRYSVKDLTTDELTAIMKSCGFEPTYGGGEKSYANCPSLHAEANALSVCDRDDRYLGTIYVTSIPCMDCAKLIANSGVARLVYRETKRGAERESRHDESPLGFLVECGLGVTKL